jgi:hypothetical protein
MNFDTSPACRAHVGGLNQSYIGQVGPILCRLHKCLKTEISYFAYFLVQVDDHTEIVIVLKEPEDREKEISFYMEKYQLLKAISYLSFDFVKPNIESDRERT